MTDKLPKRTALVLSGGGTRGAYEAGVVHYIRTQLPPHLAKNLPFHIFCGSSVGAINSSVCAAYAHDSILQGQRLVELWRNIQSRDIYARGPYSIGKLIFRTTLGLFTHILGIKGFSQPEDDTLDFHALFDTQPFYGTLKKGCPFRAISKNIREGLVEALAISATNMHTGNLEIFLQRSPKLRHTLRSPARDMRITPRHVMASAAIPILFPAVPIHGLYYSDGSLRSNTPLAPAVSLGASHILLVGTRHALTGEASNPQIRISPLLRPTLGDMLGKMLNAYLSDRLDFDFGQLERVNRVLSIAENLTPPDTYQAICQEARMQQIRTLAIFPSVNISSLVDDTIRGSYKRLRSFGMMEKFILRLLESGPGQGATLLSYFLFEPTYVEKLIDLGFQDAKAKHDELVAFAESALN